MSAQFPVAPNCCKPACQRHSPVLTTPVCFLLRELKNSERDTHYSFLKSRTKLTIHGSNRLIAAPAMMESANVLLRICEIDA